MNQPLHESSYITINIKDIIDNQTPPEQTDNNPAGGDTATPGNTPGKPTDDGKSGPAKPGEEPTKPGDTPAQKKGKVDWAKELQRRLEDNKKLSQEARESDAKIEADFWMEFYTEVFGDLAKEVNNIRQLKLDIKKLGFKKKENPILAFLVQTYVKTKLIQPGLINNDSYNTLRAAFGKRYVADSELMSKNNYNIIYCVDFWTKQASEGQQYLQLQTNILSPKASIYTQGMQERNIRVFLPPKASSMTSSNAKLNSIREVQRTLNVSKDSFSRSDATNNGSGSSNGNKSGDGGIQGIDGGQKESPASSSEELNGALAYIKSDVPATKAAALQFLASTTGSTTALNALKAGKVSSVTQSEVADAMKTVIPAFKGLKFESGKTLDSFISQISDK